MATITIELGTKSSKGTRTIYFLVKHNGTKKRIPTEVYVYDNEVSRGKIKAVNKAQAVERMRRILEDRLFDLSLDIAARDDIDAAWICQRLLATEKSAEINFLEFIDEWIEMSSAKGRKNYRTFNKRLREFVGGNNLPMSRITYNFVERFDQSLIKQQRGRSLYMGAFRHLFREAIRKYNNDIEQPIKTDPFTRYRVPKQQIRKGVRSLTQDELLRVYNWQGSGRAGFGRDCFILSFCLMGMNSVDMYEVKEMKEGRICYNRAKTRERRSDGAYIEVEVHPILYPLMEKYKGEDRIFDFNIRHCKAAELNRAVNIGLKQVGKEVGIDNLQFYQARHTFATLSRNLMGFSKSDVDEALNHVGSLGVADIYIKKDFSIINENNRKLIDKLFGKEEG